MVKLSLIKIGTGGPAAIDLIMIECTELCVCGKEKEIDGYRGGHMGWRGGRIDVVANGYTRPSVRPSVRVCVCVGVCASMQAGLHTLDAFVGSEIRRKCLAVIMRKIINRSIRSIREQFCLRHLAGINVSAARMIQPFLPDCSSCSESARPIHCVSNPSIGSESSLQSMLSKYISRWQRADRWPPLNTRCDGEVVPYERIG